MYRVIKTVDMTIDGDHTLCYVVDGDSSAFFLRRFHPVICELENPEISIGILVIFAKTRLPGAENLVFLKPP